MLSFSVGNSIKAIVIFNCRPKIFLLNFIVLVKGKVHIDPSDWMRAQNPCLFAMGHLHISDYIPKLYTISELFPFKVSKRTPFHAKFKESNISPLHPPKSVQNGNVVTTCAFYYLL